MQTCRLMSKQNTQIGEYITAMKKGKNAASKIYVKTRRETGAYSVLPEEMLK